MLKGLFSRILRSRRLWIIAVMVLLAGVPQAYAWWNWQQARTALAADRIGEARERLANSRRIWPWGEPVEVRLLGAEAARQDGDLPAAMDELREARRLAGETTPEMAFEWSLIQATDGNVGDVAEFLQQKANGDPVAQRMVWEALTEGYLAVYRFNDAFTIARLWVERYPDDLRALELRGRAAVQGRGRGLKLGVEDFQKVLERDPSRTRVRAAMAVTLLELGLFDQALPEFERLMREQPGVPDHRVRLARCLKMTNRAGEAVALLEGVLREWPDHGMALRTRGQFALADFEPAGAREWLARAATALPNDYQTQFLLYQALQQSGKTAEADEQLKRAEDVRKQSSQLTDLRSRRLAERPLDPALYVELGGLLLNTGHPEQGVRWLEEALTLDPQFRPAHDLLEAHYDKTGQPERAARHRRPARDGP